MFDEHGDGIVRADPNECIGFPRARGSLLPAAGSNARARHLCERPAGKMDRQREACRGGGRRLEKSTPLSVSGQDFRHGF
jgi:hypothetical protein